jgi:hypothetical protein
LACDAGGGAWELGVEDAWVWWVSGGIGWCRLPDPCGTPAVYRANATGGATQLVLEFPSGVPTRVVAGPTVVASSGALVLEIDPQGEAYTLDEQGARGLALVGDRVYWAGLDDGDIWSVQLPDKGLAQKQLVSSPSGDATKLAATSELIAWVDEATDPPSVVVVRSGQAEPTIVAQRPNVFALEAIDDQIVWGTSDGIFTQWLDADGPPQQLTSDPIFAYNAITLTDTMAYYVWSPSGVDGIYGIPLSGGDRTTIVEYESEPGVHTYRPSTLAVHGGYVYWADISRIMRKAIP